MKLISYVNRPHQPEGVDSAEFFNPRGLAAWVENDTVAVNVQQAYRFDCEQRGQTVDEQVCQQLAELGTMIDAGYAVDGWAEIESLRNRWQLAAKASDAAAHACQVDLRDVQLVMPVQPKSFRDFYAFEQHVSTCRRKRGLDMVPEWYEFPVFYFSNANCFRGPDASVVAPMGSNELDFELEIACVIGKAGKSIRVEEADEYVAGYVVLNDWSARDVQRAEVKVGLGPAKGKDFATSFGPMLITPVELECVRITGAKGDRYDLPMYARVNGHTISAGNFKDIHFTFAEMIHRASQDVMLYPLDVLGSGTVGTGCILELGTDVQAWLTPGDVVELEVDVLGMLRTPVAGR